MSSAHSNVNLEAYLHALRDAVSSQHSEAIALQLARIETELRGIANPLIRGLYYAEVQHSLGHSQTAADVIHDLTEVLGEDATLFYQLGCYRRSARQIDDAVAAFRRCAVLDPTKIDAWIQIGTLLDEQGEPQFALEAYRQALRVSPTDADAWRNLGNALAALGRFEEAFSAYEAASAATPNDRTLLLLRVAAVQAIGDIARANHLTPDDLAKELGPVAEVRNTSGHVELLCRFRAPAGDIERCSANARAVLQSARMRVQGPGTRSNRPDTYSSSCLFAPAEQHNYFIVRGADVLVVCDPDPVSTDRPHRFLDASRTVQNHATDDAV